jgi:hypothetical protein
VRARASLLAVGALVVLGGCTDDEPPDLASPAPAAFDCEAVAAAAATLDAAGAAELERLGLTASDPQALTVTLVAAGRAAPDYWSAVAGAVSPDAPVPVRDDVERVEAYWAGLADELEAVTVADPSPEAVTAAGDRLAAVSAGARDDAVAPAQQRVEDALASGCG